MSGRLILHLSDVRVRFFGASTGFCNKSFENTPSGFDIETFATLEKNGGRLEYRRCRKLTQLDWLEQKDEWPGLKTVFAIDRRVTAKKGTSEETGYYISSSDFSAQKLMEIAREHWKVESMHWMLDAVFSEDFS